jgi:hypothetical protein
MCRHQILVHALSSSFISRLYPLIFLSSHPLILISILLPRAAAEGFEKVTQIDAPIDGLAGWCTLRLDNATGAIVQLTDTTGDVVKEWASETNPLALLRYQSLVDDDMTKWRKEYLIIDCPSEYGKPGCMTAKPTPIKHLDPPMPVELWRKKSSDAAAGTDELLLRLKFAKELYTNYGAPEEAWVRFTVWQDAATDASASTSAGVDIDLTLIKKTTTRLPEAIFMTFNPKHHETPTPAPVPTPPPTPPPAGQSTAQHGVASIPAGAGSKGQSTVTVTFGTAFSTVPAVVVTPAQGSSGGGKSNAAPFAATVREVTKTGFTVTVQVLGDPSAWTEEASLHYIAGNISLTRVCSLTPPSYTLPSRPPI